MKMDGFIRYIWADGTSYIGWFLNNRYHGNGKLMKPDGSIKMQGWFENGMLIDKEFRVCADEKIIEKDEDQKDAK